MSKRLAALGSCLLRLGTLTWAGRDLQTHRRAVLKQFSRRFGLGEEVRPEQVVAAVALAQAEYNRLRQVEHVLYRRRVAQKVRGCRNASRSEREAAARLWQQAVEQFMTALEL